MTVLPSARTPLGLRLRLLALLLVLAVPAALLSWQAWRQVRWEGLHQQQLLARELVAAMNRTLERIRDDERVLPFEDYAFVTATGGPANLVQRSRLSTLPGPQDLPGLVGRFQVSAAGDFSTPLLPVDDPGAFGLAPTELAARREREAEVLRILEAGSGASPALPVGAPGLADGRRVGALSPEEPPVRSVDATAAAARAASPAPMALAAPSDDVSGFAAEAEEAVGAPVRKASSALEAGERRQLAGAREEWARDAAADRESPPMTAALDRARDEDHTDASEVAKASRPEPATARAGRSSGEPARQDVQLFDRLAEQVRSATSAYRGEDVDGAAVDAASDEARPALAASDVEPPFGRAEAAQAAGNEQRREPALLGPLPDPVPEDRLRSIDAQLDGLTFLRADPEHFLLVRRRFRDGQRFLQGAALARGPFLEQLVGAPFRASTVSRVADLEVSWDDAPVGRFHSATRSLGSYEALAGELLHRERLASPFDALQLTFVARAVPPGPGGAVVLWSAGSLLVLLLAGFRLLDRAGRRQIELLRQQQDFVSAVSHELRTPLTSIRLYSEMLRAGFGDEARRREYYTFIHDESERLSRLVANVLRLARMSRAGLELELEPESVDGLITGLRERLEQLAAAAQATLTVSIDDGAAAAVVEVDRDAFLQVFLNLVDNALKFGLAGRREVVLAVSEPRRGQVRFTVRDFGAGLPPGDPERLFELFHRSRREGEAKPGTGIGLALVRRLVEGMGGTVAGRAANPGAAFDVTLPRRGSPPGVIPG